MTSKTNGAPTAGTAKAQNQISNLPIPYQNLPLEAIEKAQKRIARRRADMLQAYRRTYDRALSGKSLRAAVKAQCLECMGWQREEVRACTAYPCPLWPYRDYQESAEKSPVDGEISRQNQTAAGGVVGYGSTNKEHKSAIRTGFGLLPPGFECYPYRSG